MQLRCFLRRANWIHWTTGHVFFRLLNCPVENQRLLDLAFAYGRAHLYEEAIELLRGADLDRKDGSAAMILYTIADMYALTSDELNSERFYVSARAASIDYVFPSRLEEIACAVASYSCATTRMVEHITSLGICSMTGSAMTKAIAHWERAVELAPEFATAWRNLGIAYFNVLKDEKKSLKAFDRALELNPTDGRVFYERDQLWKRVGETPENRLAEFGRHAELVEGRDDLTVELASLYNQTGRTEAALELLKSRPFQPWEGGEGLVIAQYVEGKSFDWRARPRGESAARRAKNIFWQRFIFLRI